MNKCGMYIPRSTDKSLDSVGLEDESENVLQGFSGLGLAGLANLRSDDILATMLKREPPDGKEKPEPPKHQKLENNSRKNSKCDLLEAGGAGGGGGRGDNVVDTSPHAGHVQQLQQMHVSHKTEPSSGGKRDSLTAGMKEPAGGGGGVIANTNNYLDTSNVLQVEIIYIFRRPVNKDGK